MDKNLHKIDRFFKEGIEGQKEEPSDRIWAALESQLDKQALLQAQYKYRVLRNAVAILLFLGIASATGYFYFDSSKKGSFVATDKVKSANNENKVKGMSFEEKRNGNNEGLYKTTISISAEQKTDHSASVFPKSTSVKSANESLPASQHLKSIIESSKRVANDLSVITEHFANDAGQHDQNLSLQTPFVMPIVENKQMDRPIVLPRVLNKVNRSISTGLNFVPSTAQKAILRKVRQASKSQFFITPMFVPELATHSVKEGRMEHHEEDHRKIEQDEKINSSSSIGVNLGLQLSKKLAVFVGYQKSTLKSTIAQEEIFARPRPGQSPTTENNFKLNCAAGYAYITSKSNTSAPSFGDSLKGLPSENLMQYTVIPAGVRYSLGVGRFAVSVLAGLNIHLLSKAAITANFLEANGTKSSETVSVQGVRKTYFSGFGGLSFGYKLNSAVRVFVSPLGIMGLNTINQNTPAATRRSGLGLQTGIAVSL